MRGLELWKLRLCASLESSDQMALVSDIVNCSKNHIQKCSPVLGIREDVAADKCAMLRDSANAGSAPWVGLRDLSLTSLERGLARRAA